MTFHWLADFSNRLQTNARRRSNRKPHRSAMLRRAERLDVRTLLTGGSLGPQTIGISVVAPGLFSESSGSSEFS